MHAACDRRCWPEGRGTSALLHGRGRWSHLGPAADLHPPQRLRVGVLECRKGGMTGAVPRTPFSVSERLEAFHASQRDWHRDVAEAHRKHGHVEAERQHRAAAAAHEAAMATPMDTFSTRGAMQASNRADDASQAAGVKASRGWGPPV